MIKVLATLTLRRTKEPRFQVSHCARSGSQGSRKDYWTLIIRLLLLKVVSVTERKSLHPSRSLCLGSPRCKHQGGENTCESIAFAIALEVWGLWRRGGKEGGRKERKKEKRGREKGRKGRRKREGSLLEECKLSVQLYGSAAELSGRLRAKAACQGSASGSSAPALLSLPYPVI